MFVLVTWRGKKKTKPKRQYLKYAHYTKQVIQLFSPKFSLYICHFQIKIPNLSISFILCVYVTDKLPSTISRVKDILFQINQRNLAIYVNYIVFVSNAVLLSPPICATENRKASLISACNSFQLVWSTVFTFVL